MEARDKGDGLDVFRRWLTPLLMCLIAYFGNNKLSEINNKLELISVLQQKQAVTDVKMSALEDKVNKLEVRQDATDKASNEVLYKEAEKRLKLNYK